MARVDPGCDRAAQILALFCQGVERCGCSKIDDAGGTPIQIHHCHGIGDAIGAHGVRVLIANFDPGLDANIHNEGIVVEIFLACLDDTPCQLRDHRGKANAVQILLGMTGILQKSQKLQSIFIRHAGMIGGKPPMREERVAVIQSEGEVGVTDVDCEEHNSSIHVNR